jgi:hypothetical protein
MRLAVYEIRMPDDTTFQIFNYTNLKVNGDKTIGELIGHIEVPNATKIININGLTFIVDGNELRTPDHFNIHQASSC